MANTTRLQFKFPKRLTDTQATSYLNLVSSVGNSFINVLDTNMNSIFELYDGDSYSGDVSVCCSREIIDTGFRTHHLRQPSAGSFLFSETESYIGRFSTIETQDDFYIITVEYSSYFTEDDFVYTQGVSKNLLESIFGQGFIQVITVAGGDKFLSKTGLVHYDGKIKNLIDSKQPKLVSGVNIKKINNESLLGSGNLQISSGKTYTGGKGITVDNVNDKISIDSTAYEITGKVEYVGPEYLLTTPNDNTLGIIVTGSHVQFSDSIGGFDTILRSTETINDTDWSALWQ